MIATKEEMKDEIILRMQLLNVSKKEIDMFENGYIPITTFNGETQNELESIHKKTLKLFEEKNVYGLTAFYITESWHFADMISILYVSPEKDDWEWERKEATKGIHSIFAYNVDADYYEFGSGIFTIEDDVLWRAG